MNSPEEYQEARAQLLRVVSQGGRRISLVEFTTLPQLQEILAELRSAHPERPFVEITYDPIANTAPEIISKIGQELSGRPEKPLPLVVLHPRELRATPEDEHAAYDFWQAMNFRRELLGGFHAQVLLCVDPWHIKWLSDRALDLWSWLMPKIHLTEPPDLAPARAESLPALSAFFDYRVSPEAAERQWLALWPQLQKKSSEHLVGPGDLRRYVFPLLEAALATGNLVRARQVRDLAVGVPLADEDKIEWHRLNALLACGAADFGQTEEHARKLLEIAVQGDEHKIRMRAATALTLLANILWNFGCFEAAENLYRAALALSEKVFGLEHPNTLRIRGNLANARFAQGKYAEVEAEHRAVLKIMERVLGTEHPLTLNSRLNLANALFAQGMHAEAEAEYRAVIKLNERVLGPEHPDTLNSRSNLANTLFAQGKYVNAEVEQRAVFKLAERVLGAEHPDTLVTRNNLANGLRTMGKYAEAEAEHRALLNIRERVLGREHPDTLISRQNLAGTLYQEGKPVEAEAEGRALLKLNDRVLGPEHPYTLASRANLAGAFGAQGRHAEAEAAYRAILDVQEHTLGSNHPNTLISYYNLALSLSEQGKLEDASHFAQLALEGARKILSADHPDTKLYEGLHQALLEKKQK